MQAYSDPKRESDPHALPDLEVFFLAAGEMDVGDDDAGEPIPCERGWHYWFCFPGCMPDGELQGPFATEAEALVDARAGLNDDDA